MRGAGPVPARWALQRRVMDLLWRAFSHPYKTSRLQPKPPCAQRGARCPSEIRGPTRGRAARAAQRRKRRGQPIETRRIRSTAPDGGAAGGSTGFPHRFPVPLRRSRGCAIRGKGRQRPARSWGVNPSASDLSASIQPGADRLLVHTPVPMNTNFPARRSPQGSAQCRAISACSSG